MAAGEAEKGAKNQKGASARRLSVGEWVEGEDVS